MMIGMVLLLILQFGLQVLVLRGVARFVPFGIGRFCQGRLEFGIRTGLLSLHLSSVLLTLPIGPTLLLVFWFNGLPFLVLCIGPLGGVDLGVGGISYVELLILYELWAGERLSLEKSASVSSSCAPNFSVPFGPRIDIWRSCRFIGALMRSLCLLPGGLARFVHRFIGANHCRLRHIG